MGKSSELVIFDLFETILDKEWFDYGKVLEYLHGKYFAGFSRADVDNWASDYRSLRMADRNETGRESGFIDQLKYYEERSGTRYPDDYDIIERDVFPVCRGERVGNHVPEALEHLKSRGHPLAILSNSIFSSGCLIGYLESFGLSKYFDRVFSSADLGVRKPFPSAFHQVCGVFGADPKETWFVGNNKEKDVKGAANAGLKAVYYDRVGDGYDGYCVSDLKELKEIIR